MNQDNNQKNQSIKVVFDNNLSFVFLYKKTEKLAAAVYLVTALIKDEDHLKWQLRKKGLDLLSETLLVSRDEINDRKQGQKISALLVEMVSLFEIAFLNKIVSEMNFSILKQEFVALLSMLEAEIFPGSSSPLVLSNDFFNIDTVKTGDHTQDSLKGPLNRAVESKGHIEENKMSFIADNKRHLSQVTNTKVDSSKTTKSDRKSVILDILRTKKEVSVTDLVESIKGYSEKTIQRELLSMVKDGVLKKQGERRWSKYMRA